MKKTINKWGYYLLGILLSLVILITIFIIKKITPFGNNSFLTIDFYHQYGPMLGGMQRRIFSGGNLIYSFNSGLGLPIFRNFMNYLASPFNLLILLFKYRGLLTSFSFIIGFKAVASCITMLYYLKEKFDKDYRFIPLGIIYAFSAYFVAYYWNIMWIDGMYMLPLITLGIEKLVDKNTSLLYTLSLSLMLFINYFIGYMLCIFSVLYFILYMVIKTDKFDKKVILKKIVRFAISSLLAGGIAAVLLVPLFLSLKEISATTDAWPTGQYYAFTFKEFLFGHFSGIGATVFKSDIVNSPNVACSVISVLFLMVFWFNEKVKLKIKIGYTLFLLILVLSFVIGPIDYIWHGMHVPNDLPYRYSFIYSFILIIMGSYAVWNIKFIKWWQILISYIICLILVISMKVFEYENITNEMIVINGMVLTIYSGMIFLYLKKPKLGRYALSVILLILVTETVFNLYHNWNDFTLVDQFYENYDDYKKTLNYIGKEEKDKFYRLEFLDLLNFSNAIWYDYYGIDTFSSMQYYDMAKFINHLGGPGNGINSYYYKKNTPIYDMMLDLKYILGDVNDRGYTFLNNVGNIDIYQNKYTLGLMCGVDKDILLWSGTANAFFNQNDFLLKSTGVSDTLEPITNLKTRKIYDEDGRQVFEIKFLNDYNNYYVYDEFHEADFLVVGGKMYHVDEGYEYVYELDNINYGEEVNYGEQYIINNLDYNSEESTIYVGGYNIDSNAIKIYRLNNDKFLQAYLKLKDNVVEITKFKESKIIGTYDFEENMVMYTSIPYDKGWQVYIDNKRVKEIKLGNALLGYKAPKGKHTVILRYKIPYFKLGLTISLISIFGLLIYHKIIKIKKV